MPLCGAMGYHSGGLFSYLVRKRKNARGSTRVWRVSRPCLLLLLLQVVAVELSRPVVVRGGWYVDDNGVTVDALTCYWGRGLSCGVKRVNNKQHHSQPQQQQQAGARDVSLSNVSSLDYFFFFLPVTKNSHHDSHECRPFLGRVFFYKNTNFYLLMTSTYTVTTTALSWIILLVCLFFISQLPSLIGWGFYLLPFYLVLQYLQIYFSSTFVEKKRRSPTLSGLAPHPENWFT